MVGAIHPGVARHFVLSLARPIDAARPLNSYELMHYLMPTTIALASLVAVAQHTSASGPVHGSMLRLTATAYCQEGKTKSGAHTRTGIVAADPRLLPVGSIVRITSPQAHAGLYTVMDTGAAVAGHRLDIFMADCARAKKFGKQMIRIRVLRRGWNRTAGADDQHRDR